MKNILNKKLIERYSRQIVLKDIGPSGQKKIIKSRVLIVGAGGLGCPVIDYLSRAGIGNIGVVDHDKINISNIQRSVVQTCNIGYWLGEPNIKKGYMEESMRSIIPYIFKNLKINRIQAFTLNDNISSRNLLEKLNFKKEGVLREAMKINNVWEDHILYALLNSDHG